VKAVGVGGCCGGQGRMALRSFFLPFLVVEVAPCTRQTWTPVPCPPLRCFIRSLFVASCGVVSVLNCNASLGGGLWSWCWLECSSAPVGLSLSPLPSGSATVHQPLVLPALGRGCVLDSSFTHNINMTSTQRLGSVVALLRHVAITAPLSSGHSNV